jgi:hypothetical protein
MRQRDFRNLGEALMALDQDSNLIDRRRMERIIHTQMMKHVVVPTVPTSSMTVSSNIPQVSVPAPTDGSIVSAQLTNLSQISPLRASYAAGTDGSVAITADEAAAQIDSLNSSAIPTVSTGGPTLATQLSTLATTAQNLTPTAVADAAGITALLPDASGAVQDVSSVVSYVSPAFATSIQSQFAAMSSTEKLALAMGLYFGGKFALSMVPMKYLLPMGAAYLYYNYNKSKTSSAAPAIATTTPVSGMC